MDDVMTLISTVGFPIVACIYMARIMRAEIQTMTTAVNKLTTVVDDLNERLDRLEDKKYER